MWPEGWGKPLPPELAQNLGKAHCIITAKGEEVKRK